MITEITSKQQLESIALALRNNSNQLGTDVSSIISTLNGVSDYDGINITQVANTLANNLQIIMGDLNGVVSGISSYIQQVNSTDVYEINSNANFNSALNNNTDNYGTNNTVNNSYETNNNSYGTNSTVNNSSDSSYNYYNSTSSNNNVSNSNSGVSIPVVPVIPSVNTSVEQINSGQRAERVVISMGDSNYQMLGKYSNNASSGFNVTTGNFSYQLTDKDFDLLCAIVASEGNLSYDESLAVVSTILNRCDNSEFITMFGKDPIAQITGLNQFTSYGNGSYKSYLNGKAPVEVINAVKDALSGVRNHRFCNYKANSFSDFSSNMITSSGNRYK